MKGFTHEGFKAQLKYMKETPTSDCGVFLDKEEGLHYKIYRGGILVTFADKYKLDGVYNKKLDAMNDIQFELFHELLEDYKEICSEDNALKLAIDMALSYEGDE